MKTIEKRAEKYADTYVIGDAAIIVDIVHKVAKEAYIAGATEMKAIDIDKACEYFADWMRRHNDYAQFAVDGLRKAMKEHGED